MFRRNAVVAAPSRPSARAGFSLIELMVVIAIMGLLATVVAVKVVDHLAWARRVKVAADFSALKQSVQTFRLAHGRWPDRLEDLWEKPSRSTVRWKKLVEDAPPAPVDPWGHSYVYRRPTGDDELELISYGADGAPGGTDEGADLSSRTIGKEE